jgi:hypothetical protein
MRSRHLDSIIERNAGRQKANDPIAKFEIIPYAVVAFDKSKKLAEKALQQL